MALVGSPTWLLEGTCCNFDCQSPTCTLCCKMQAAASLIVYSNAPRLIYCAASNIERITLHTAVIGSDPIARKIHDQCYIEFAVFRKMHTLSCKIILISYLYYLDYDISTLPTCEVRQKYYALKKSSPFVISH